jgi:hypothetical protein
MTSDGRNLLIAAGLSALLAIAGTLGVLSWTGRLSTPETSPQAVVHEMGGHVMPFDLGETTHIFEMTESGGVQQVIADDPGDSAQVELIQMHLQHEAMRFAAGDFSDPASLHGSGMPGIPEMSAGFERIRVEYAVLPDGGQITFTTDDLHLITAVHRWFGAQLSDHGADATYR